MCPKQGLGSCQKIYKLKANDKVTFFSLAEKLVLPSASARKPEEREFVVDSGASMHMVSEKDLNSAELETMRTSRSPTTVMTANGEVRTNKEATVYVKQIGTYHWKSGQIQISKKMARELVSIFQTMYHVWFLVYQRVLLQPHLHLLHHLHHRILFDLM